MLYPIKPKEKKLEYGEFNEMIKRLNYKKNIDLNINV